MGAEGAVEIIFRKQVQEAEDPAAKRAELIANFRQIIDVYVAAGNDMIDDVIDPRETRPTICRALEMAVGQARASGRGSATAWCRSEPMSNDPGRHHVRDLRRDRQPRPVPGDPLHAAGVRAPRRGGSSTRAACTSTSTRARPDGTPSYEVEDFVAIRDAIRGEVGDAAIINFSTGTVGVPVAKRIAYLEAGRPEVAALNMGSMNYAKYSRSRKDFVFKFVFANPFDEIIELLEAMRRLDIKPEHECFDLGHVGSLAPLVDMGLLDAPLHADFVMGVVGGCAGERPQPGGDGRQPAGGKTPLGRDRDRARPVDAGRGRAHPRRLDPRRARGQLLPARRRDGPLQRRPRSRRRGG